MPTGLLDDLRDSGYVDSPDSGEDYQKAVNCDLDCRNACRWGENGGLGAQCDDGIWDDENKTCTCINECATITEAQCQIACEDFGCDNGDVDGEGDDRACTCSGCSCEQPECVFTCVRGSWPLWHFFKITVFWQVRRNSCPEGKSCHSIGKARCATLEHLGRTKAGECR